VQKHQGLQNKSKETVRIQISLAIFPTKSGLKWLHSGQNTFLEWNLGPSCRGSCAFVWWQQLTAHRAEVCIYLFGLTCRALSHRAKAPGPSKQIQGDISNPNFAGYLPSESPLKSGLKWLHSNGLGFDAPIADRVEFGSREDFQARRMQRESKGLQT
jgi:hypothetical protein